MRFRSICYVAVLAFAITPAAVRAGGPDSSRDVGVLLSEARQNATQAWWGAAEMQQFRLSRIGWESHTAKLTQIKGLVNAVAQRVAELTERKSEASPAQRQEIERLQLALLPLVASYENTFQHLRHNQQNIDACVRSDPEYQALLNTNAGLAERLVKR